ncbi:MAG: TatD family hydrolase [Peptococcaceae bacterium]|jgi:TatD DNase family protein|nr:TatD family hydrolase [Peptococcaceae bacterium]
MTTLWFDSHAHVDDEQFEPDQEQVIRRAFDAGVGRMVNIGCDRQAALNTLALVERYENIYGTVGFHPHNAKDLTDDLLAAARAWAAHPKIVAIGEIGLDFHYDFSPRPAQREAYRRQIRLARELGLPITIHDREAHREAFDILTEEGGWEQGGIFHCYSGGAEMAREIVRRGFYISFSGVLTFANAEKTRAAAAAVPLDRLLIETDCPYLAPAPYRGQRNEPAYVVKTGEALAALRGVTPADMARITWENACRVYRISD